MKDKDFAEVQREIIRICPSLIDCPKCNHKTLACKTWDDVFSPGYLVCCTCGSELTEGLVERKPKSKK